MLPLLSELSRERNRIRQKPQQIPERKKAGDDNVGWAGLVSLGEWRFAFLAPLREAEKERGWGKNCQKQKEVSHLVRRTHHQKATL